ncbi:DUF3857 domain-containing transglutaminase family protein [Microbulbifer sediminum]|uniref:DUF3857 domain-containing transglutaminase family protein n=1 Tax=Microbulbifer sediminum TaxID=2904250 RepID=UPI001F3E2B65|nr:DUF3857 domain-containing protein [Microbulbifer sediminum]
MNCRHVFHLIAQLLLFFSTSAIASPELLFGPHPEWVTSVQIEGDSQRESGSVRYHLSNSQAFYAGKKKQSYFQLVMEPLNKQGIQEVSELTLSFYPAYERLTVHEITVQRNNNLIDRLDPEAFKLFQSEEELSSKLYSERWNALYILEDIRPGDVISYSYTISGSNPIFERSDFGTLFLNWPQAVDRRYIKLTSSSPLHYRFNNRKETVKHRRTDQGYEYVIDLKEVPAVALESQYPRWHEPLNFFQYSGYQSWEEVNKWALSLYEIDRKLPAEVKKSLETWKSELGLPGAISKAIQFVQEDIRYFGIELGVNSHLPRTPRETLNKRYGDCKDKALLLSSMLAHLGVESHPALVSSSRGRAIGADIPSPQAFDHVITLIQFDGKKYWIDGTATGQGSDFRNKGFFDYRLALPIRPGTQKLEKVEPAAKRNRILSAEIEENFTLDPASNFADLTIRSKFSHLKAEQARQFFLSADQKQASKNHTNFMAQYYPGVKLDKSVQHFDTLEDNELVVIEQYKIEDIGKLTSARKIFTLYGSSILSHLSKPEDRIRHTPMAVAHPLELSHRSTAEISGEILWRESPDTVTIDNPWFTFSRTVSRRDSVISVEFNFISKTDHVKHGDLPGYISQLEALDQALQYQFWAKGNRSDKEKGNQEVKDLIKSLIRK